MSHLEDGTLHELVDGEIPSSDLAAIQQHLASCAECRARLDAARELAGGVEAMVALIEVPEGGTSDTVPLVRRQRPARWLRELPWAAAVVAAAGLGYLVRRPRSIPPAPATTIATEHVHDTVFVPAPTATRSEPPTPTQHVATVAKPSVPSPPRDTSTAAAPPVTDETRGARDAVRQPRADVAAKSTSLPVDSLAGKIVAANEPARVSNPPATTLQIGSPSQLAGRGAGGGRGGIPANRLVARAAVRPVPPAISIDTIPFTDAVRQLGGALRLIDGMVPARLERQGEVVRVIYPGSTGELVLKEQLVDGKIVVDLIGPAGFPADSLARLRARVKE